MPMGGHVRAMHRSAAFLLGLAALAAACGGSSADDDASAEDAQQASRNAITVSAREFSFEADQQTVAAGRVTLTLVNRGSVPHDLVVVRTDLAPDKLPAKNGVADVPASEEIAHVHDVRAGARKSVSEELKPGKYVLICNVPAHYQAGMHLALTVE